MKGYRRYRERTSGNNGSFWLSFSDMMSVLVLIFIFVIFSMMYTLKKAQDDYVEAHNEYEIALAELEAANNEKANLIVLVSNYENQLSDTKAELDQTKQQLIVITGEKKNLQTELDEQSRIVVDLRARDENNTNEILRLNRDNAQLTDANSSLTNQLRNTQYELNTARSNLNLTQTQLENARLQLAAILGVKADIITDLSNEFARYGEVMGVDPNTGAMTLSSATMFNKGNAELSDAGKSTLDQYLPRYLNVLLSDKYRGYVAEIIIEGHTDSSPRAGYASAYLGNLDLSLDRAQAVADYMLNPDYMRYTLRLSETQAEYFQSLVTTSGRSSSDLIQYNGREDATASRRVVIKFRLIDADSIQATKNLIE